MIEIASIGLLSAFVAGLISFISPCVLPLVPGYLSYVAGRSVDELQSLATRGERFAIVVASLVFVLGFSTVFVALGTSATALGRLLLAYKQEAYVVAGIVVIAFGLFMTGILPLRWLYRDMRLLHRLPQGRGLWWAYVLGLAFAFGWTPCIGPILGSILTVGATQTDTVSGVTLLSVYSLGLGLPFVLTAVFVKRFLAHARMLRRLSRPIHIVSGAVLVLMGGAMITGYLTVLSYWLLNLFPVLGRVG